MGFAKSRLLQSYKVVAMEDLQPLSHKRVLQNISR